MSKIITNKIETIVAPGTSIASDVTSKKINLNNYQSAKVVISSSDGTSATTTAKVIAVIDTDNEVEIKSESIVIGGSRENAIDIVANEIAHYDAKAIKIEIAGITSSTLTIGAIVVLAEPRYEVQNDTVVEDANVEDNDEDEEEKDEDNENHEGDAEQNSGGLSYVDIRGHKTLFKG